MDALQGRCPVPQVGGVGARAQVRQEQAALALVAVASGGACGGRRRQQAWPRCSPPGVVALATRHAQLRQAQALPPAPVAWNQMTSAPPPRRRVRRWGGHRTFAPILVLHASLWQVGAAQSPQHHLAILQPATACTARHRPLSRAAEGRAARLPTHSTARHTPPAPTPAHCPQACRPHLQHAQADGVLALPHEAAGPVDGVEHPVPALRASRGRSQVCGAGVQGRGTGGVGVPGMR